MSTLSSILPSTRATSSHGNSLREKVGDRVTIYKTDSSPLWYIQYNLEGKQFKRSLKTQSKKRALELATKKDAQLTLGQVEQPSVRPITVHDAKESYLKKLSAKGRSPKTCATYRSKLEAFESYCDQQVIPTLKRVTASVLESYQEQLETIGVSPTSPKRIGKHGPHFKAGKNKPSTIRDKLKIVRQLLKWALKRQLLLVDPAPGYDLPPAQRGQAHCWSPAELTLILANVPPEMLDLFQFLRLTGLRVDELCWLMKADFFEDHPHLKIRAKVCPLTNISWKPKHGQERIVPLCAQAIEIAKRAKAASPGDRLFFAPDTAGKKLGRWRPQRIWKILKSTMKAAGVKQGTTHTFRHVFCSFLANQERVSPFQIMKVLGHGSLDIVLNYCHATEEQLIDAITAVPFERMEPVPVVEGGTNLVEN